MLMLMQTLILNHLSSPTVLNIVASANGSAPVATTWTAVAAGASPSLMSASACPPTMAATTHIITNAEKTIPRGAAKEHLAASGPAIGSPANQLQFSWQEWISWNFHHVSFHVFRPTCSHFITRPPHKLF